MTDFPEWAAFAGLANNKALSPHERLGSAIRAIELLEEALTAARAKADFAPAKSISVMTRVSDDSSQAWKDLVEALTLLSKGQSNEISPLHCEHDELTVCADPTEFTMEERSRLKELGFLVDDDAFKSYRFGSA